MKFLTESIKVFKQAEKLKNELLTTMVNYLKDKGYEDAEEYIAIELSDYTNFQGDKMIEVEIRNDLVKFYKEEKLIDLLDKIVEKYHKDSYFEPEYSTVWHAYLYNMQLDGSLTEVLTDEDRERLETAYMLQKGNATNIKLENGILRIPIYGKEYFIDLSKMSHEELAELMVSNKKRG
jgi:antitoxin component of MazEF toxin-antitoxin module